jgi:hypothetical protein
MASNSFPEQKSALNIVMVRNSISPLHEIVLYHSPRFAMSTQGAMTFGAPGKDMARVHELKDVEAILDVFVKHGHREVGVCTGKPAAN